MKMFSKIYYVKAVEDPGEIKGKENSNKKVLKNMER